MSSLLSVLKIAILMLWLIGPKHLKMSLTKDMVNLKSVSFVVIMLLNKGLTHIHSQKKPRLHFSVAFHFNFVEGKCKVAETGNTQGKSLKIVLRFEVVHQLLIS